MATADQVTALIRCHAEGDDERFCAVALQIAARAGRQGHTKFAQELRALVDQAKAKAMAVRTGPGQKPVPIAQPKGELAGLLTVGYSKTRLTEMALEEPLRARLERILIEQRERSRIREHGFAPSRKLLLVGPPGTGSIHSDILQGFAADIAERGVIGVVPVSGWWKEQRKRDRSEKCARYALVVSIEAPGVEADIWTPVATQIGVPVAIVVEAWPKPALALQSVHGSMDAQGSAGLSSQRLSRRGLARRGASGEDSAGHRGLSRCGREDRRPANEAR